MANFRSLQCRVTRNLLCIFLPAMATALFDRNLQSINIHGFGPGSMLQLTSSRRSSRVGGRFPAVVGICATAAAAKPALTPDESRIAQIRKFASSVDHVVSATMSGFCGPWVMGFVFGTFGGIRSLGFKAAVRSAVTTGNQWGVLSAAFCGMEVLAREIRGKTDKWNNMVGACSAGAVSSCSRGPQAMLVGCMNFAGMSYLLDLFMSKQQDSFDKYVQDPSQVDRELEGAVGRKNKAS